MSERSKRVKYFQHMKRNFLSPSGNVMFYLSYKHQLNTKPFHRNSFILRKVIFSHVKITCYFHVWRYHVFVRQLTWYFIGVYIIKYVILIEGMALNHRAINNNLGPVAGQNRRLVTHPYVVERLGHFNGIMFPFLHVFWRNSMAYTVENTYWKPLEMRFSRL